MSKKTIRPTPFVNNFQGAADVSPFPTTMAKDQAVSRHQTKNKPKVKKK